MCHVLNTEAAKTMYSTLSSTVLVMQYMYYRERLLLCVGILMYIIENLRFSKILDPDINYLVCPN